MIKAQNYRWHRINTTIYLMLVFSVAMVSCNGQDKTNKTTDSPIVADTITSDNLRSPLQSSDQSSGVNLLAPPRISDFVRRIFQDQKGNLWFGTNGDGVVRYDGNSLEYFSIDQGFGGVAVRGIIEDKEGNLWFGTEGGITKYNGTSFTNFTEKEGLIHNDIWSIIIDKNGLIWIGTREGVTTFNGKKFTPFEIPDGKPDPTRGVTSAKIVHAIMEDSKGRIWFGNNAGVHVYDGKLLSNGQPDLITFSEKEGLSNNNVNSILEDKNGAIWIATTHNGICRFDPPKDLRSGKATFVNMHDKHNLNGEEVWSIYEDSQGSIWFPVKRFGVYRYDGRSFKNFRESDGLSSEAIQSIFQDRDGRIWLGGWLGLNRYNPSAAKKDQPSFIQVSTLGPWR